MNGAILRELASVTELKRAEEFQREVWGEDDPVDNSDLLLSVQHEGGLVAGAFDGDRMLGFLFGFPTADPHAQHSHRLGISPDAQGMGLGARLKWFQRDWCLTRGITKVRWTYDPVRRANAALNIARLGAGAGVYHADYYGVMVGINAGVPSDRLLAEWRLDAPGVIARAKAPRAAPPPTDGVVGRVAIPADFAALAPEAALAERLRVRAALTAAFAQGQRIEGFDLASGEYLLAAGQG